MSESALFLIGFVIFGVAIAGTLVATIAGDDSEKSSEETTASGEHARSVSENSVEIKHSLKQIAAML